MHELITDLSLSIILLENVLHERAFKLANSARFDLVCSQDSLQENVRFLYGKPHNVEVVALDSIK